MVDASYPNAVLPKGSIVLVTGAGGFIGSVISRDLLELGYKVRAATRSAARLQNLKKKFEGQYGPGTFDIVEVADATVPGAYDEALKGAAGFLHVATDSSFSNDTKKVVDASVVFTLEALKSAAKTPSVKRVVLTSSRIAAYYLPDGGHVEIKDSVVYNEEFNELAWKAPDDHPMKAVFAYTASKVEAEKEAWKFVKEQNPSFKLNVVMPDLVIGEVLNPEEGEYPSSARWIKDALVKQDLSYLPAFQNPSGPYVGVDDTSRIHIGALLDPEIINERLWASAGPWDLNRMLDIFRNKYGADKVMSDIELKHATYKVNKDQSDAILRKLGRNGWDSLEDAVLKNIEGLVV